MVTSEPARPHGAAGRNPGGVAYRLWLPLGHPLASRRHHRHQRHRRRTADHADRRRDRGEHRQAARRALGARPHVAFRTRRSRRCAAWSPPGPASRCCPTSSTGRGRWKATASRSRDISGSLPVVAGRHGVAARLGPDAAARDFIGVAQSQRMARGCGGQARLTCSALKAGFGGGSKAPAPASRTMRRNVGHSIRLGARTCRGMRAAPRASRSAAGWCGRVLRLSPSSRARSKLARPSGCHACPDLVQRESGGARQRDQRAGARRRRVEQPLRPRRADRCDEPFSS